MANNYLQMKLFKTNKFWQIFLSMNATVLFVTPQRLMLQMIIWSLRSCDTEHQPPPPASADACLGRCERM